MKEYKAYRLTEEEAQNALREVLGDETITLLRNTNFYDFYEAESYSQFLDGSQIDERMAQILDVKECVHFAADDGMIVLVTK